MTAAAPSSCAAAAARSPCAAARCRSREQAPGARAMPRVLTTNAIITCPHGGLGTTTPVTPLWQAQGGLVAAAGDPGVLSCVFIVPCVGYTLRSMGLNATTVAGRAAILATDFQQSLTGL